MKKIALLLIGMLFFATLPIFAQTGQITLQVDWANTTSLAKNVPMGVYVDGSEVFTLMWKESKEITLSSGSHTLSVRMKGGSFKQPDTISFSANSGRVVFRATPISGWSANSIELVQVSPSSQPQSVAQQPQANNNQPRANSGNTQQGTTPNSSNVIDVNIITLLREIDNNASRAQQLYGGKTIQTTGIVDTIQPDSVWISNKRGSVWDEDDEFLGVLYVYPSDRSKLANLRKGQTITVRGVIGASGNGPRVILRAVIE
jgi:hypothetical protein